MASFQWDVKPYAKVSELINAYTNTVMAATYNKAAQRSEEAEVWMKQNAPWNDRSEEIRALHRQYGKKVPDRHAREALTVELIQGNANRRRQIEAMKLQPARTDKWLLEAVNRTRASINATRTKSRQLPMWTKVPKKFSAKQGLETKIALVRGPIVELEFKHGEDIWYAVWLEIARGGRWGIISKAIEYWSPILMRDVKQLANLKQFNITIAEEQVTEAERFAEHVRTQNQMLTELGETRRYQPWTAERQLARKQRRVRYGKEKETSASTKVAQAEYEEWDRQRKIAEATPHLWQGETPGGSLNLRPDYGTRRRR